MDGEEMPDYRDVPDARRWRVGNHYNVHGYRETVPGKDDEPIFTAMRPGIAEQIVREHNLVHGHEVRELEKMRTENAVLKSRMKLIEELGNYEALAQALNCVDCE